MISHEHRCIFVHIPKNAGNSINRVFGVEWQDHKDLQRYADELPPGVFESYCKFAIVRNPWERILSDYNYQIKRSRPGSTRLYLFKPDGERRRFSEWVETALTNPHLHPPESWGGEVSPGLHRLSPQVDWISVKGEVAVDHVIRLEELQAGFDQLCRILHLPRRRVPRRNRRLHWHYSWYYDDATRERVADYYREDVAAFGYEFETLTGELSRPLRRLALSPLFGHVFAWLRLR